MGHFRGNQLEIIQQKTKFAYGYDKQGICTLPNATNNFDIFTDQWTLDNLDCVYCFAPEFGGDWCRFDILVTKINTSLRSGGIFILDHFNFNSFPIGKNWKDYKMADSFVSLSHYTRNQTDMTCKRVNILKDWTKEDMSIVWRVFSQPEILEIMTHAGFELLNFYIDFDINQPISDWGQIPSGKRLVSAWTKK